MRAFLSEVGLVSALGVGAEETRKALFADAPSGVVPSTDFAPGPPLAVGRVVAPLPDASAWPLGLRSRNNRLLAKALEQLRAAIDGALSRVGPHRVGFVLGTSTSGIGEAEAAVGPLRRQGALSPGYHYTQQELGRPAAFLAATGHARPHLRHLHRVQLERQGAGLGRALLEAGLVDVVIAGGFDSLCRFTVAGFGALDSVSAERCNPMRRNRNGINIGEAAALFLVNREGPVRLAGWGESSDAHHLSAPEPSGQGARRGDASWRWRRPSWSRATSATSTSTAPARYRTTPWSHARWPRCWASRRPSHQPSRSLATRWGPRARWRPPFVFDPGGEPRGHAGSPLLGRRAGRGAPRASGGGAALLARPTASGGAKQLVRLRW